MAFRTSTPCQLSNSTVAIADGPPRTGSVPPNHVVPSSALRVLTKDLGSNAYDAGTQSGPLSVRPLATPVSVEAVADSPMLSSSFNMSASLPNLAFELNDSIGQSTSVEPTIVHRHLGMDPLQVAAQELRDSPLPSSLDDLTSGGEATLTGGGLVLHVDLSADGCLATVTSATATDSSQLSDNLGQIFFQSNQLSGDSLQECTAAVLDDDFALLINDSSAQFENNSLDMERSDLLSGHVYTNPLSNALAAAGVTPDPPPPPSSSSSSLSSHHLSSSMSSLLVNRPPPYPNSSSNINNNVHLSYLLSTKPMESSAHLKTARFDLDQDLLLAFSNE